MRIPIPHTAFGLALVAWAPAANAQTVITRQIVDQPVETVITQQPDGTVITQQQLIAPAGAFVSLPVRTVETTETTRIVRPNARPIVRRQVVTTRQTVVRERVIPAQTVAANPPRALYDTVVPASFPTAPAQPLYDEAPDTAVPAPVADESVVGAPAATAIPFYRYVYESDRILVIDPNTNIAIEAIPR